MEARSRPGGMRRSGCTSPTTSGSACIVRTRTSPPTNAGTSRRRRPEDYPLFLTYPYLNLYRRQVIKQADLVLALFLRGDAFTAEEKRRDFEYYEALTVRDSSLSACIQSVVAAEVGHLDLAYDYLAEAALMDLRDLDHDVLDGVHVASLGGALLAVLAGFGGMRDWDGQVSFAPRLPRASSECASGSACVAGACAWRSLPTRPPTRCARRIASSRSHTGGSGSSLRPGASASERSRPHRACRRRSQPAGRAPLRRGDAERGQQDERT